MRVQIDPKWGPKGLDWSNRSEVQDLYSALVQQVRSLGPMQSRSLHAALQLSCLRNTES